MRPVVHYGPRVYADPDFAFFNMYKTYMWINECKKYETATECLDKDLASEALEMIYYDIVVDPKSLMKKIHYLPFSMSKDDMLKEFNNLSDQPIKDKLKEYVNLYAPSWFRLYLFWNGYKKLRSESFLDKVKGISMIEESKINIDDEIIKNVKDNKFDIIYETLNLNLDRLFSFETLD